MKYCYIRNFFTANKNAIATFQNFLIDFTWARISSLISKMDVLLGNNHPGTNSFHLNNNVFVLFFQRDDILLSNI